MSGERTRVHLVRHGEVHNPRGVLYGRLPDYHLSEAGVEMARRVALRLKGRDIVHLASSPMERAQETAQPLAEQFKLPVTVDDRLIEASNHFEGLTVGVGDGALRAPRHWWRLRNPVKPSWGEPYKEIAERMLGAAEAARDAARNREAVCVSHQLPIWTLRSYLEGRRLWHDPRRRECGLASVTTLVYAGHRLLRVEYAEPAGPTPAGVVPGA
ncbi:MAG: histidine phosphatase family protein [Geodermatophilaceae bacterium]|nr:histidine phosphatase family protein [Geodermatophilaceae bacterium]